MSSFAFHFAADAGSHGMKSWQHATLLSAACSLVKHILELKNSKEHLAMTDKSFSMLLGLTETLCISA